MKFFYFAVFSLSQCLLIFSCFVGDPKQKKILTPEEKLISEGQKMYHIRGCVKCHGFKGDGKGPLMMTYRGTYQARDFSNLKVYRQGSDLKQIMETIKVGITNAKTPMPVYPYLSEEERLSIATYIIYLRELSLKSTNF